MYDPYLGGRIDDQYAADNSYLDDLKIARDPYTEGGMGMGMPYSPYGYPRVGMGMYGMPFRRGRRFKNINLGNLYIGQNDKTFSETRKVIKEEIRSKHPYMSDALVNLRSFAETLFKHPFRKSVSNAAYKPMIVDLATQKFGKYY